MVGYRAEPDFDERWYSAQPGQFPPFRVGDADSKSVSATGFAKNTELLVFKVKGLPFAIRTMDLAYHHVVQGSIKKEPFMVSFCGVCHSGALMDPRVDGRVHHFSCAGLYKGTAIQTDEETGTLWDHITGRALHGALAGKKLKVSPLEVTDIETALKTTPDLQMFMPPSGKGFIKRVMNAITAGMHRTGMLPPFFTKTMPKEDDRLPRMTTGLGVVIDSVATFFPMKVLQAGAVQTSLNGQDITVAIRDDDHRPGATLGDGSKPLQYFLRWYGFAFTFPGCAVYDAEQPAA